MPRRAEALDGCHDRAALHRIGNFDLSSDNANPGATWSDDTTLWALDATDKKIYAYALSDGTADTTSPQSGDEQRRPRWDVVRRDHHMGVRLGRLQAVRVHDGSMGTQDGGSDFSLMGLNAAANSLGGVWSDGAGTIWVAHRSTAGSGRATAFNTGDGSLDTDRTFDLSALNSNPAGMWSDGRTMWVLDTGADRVFAYDLDTGRSRPHRYVDALTARFEQISDTAPTAVVGIGSPTGFHVGESGSGGPRRWPRSLPPQCFETHAEPDADGNIVEPDPPIAPMPPCDRPYGRMMWVVDGQNNKVHAIRLHPALFEAPAAESVTAGGGNRSAPPPPDNVRAVTQKSGAVALTWEAPDGAAVTGYRIERRRAGEDLRGSQSSDGRPRDQHTLVEDTGSADTGYTDKSAEEGVDHEYRVSSRNEAGPGEGSDWVRAGPEEEPVWGDGPPGAPGNLTITAGDQGDHPVLGAARRQRQRARDEIPHRVEDGRQGLQKGALGHIGKYNLYEDRPGQRSQVRLPGKGRERQRQQLRTIRTGLRGGERHSHVRVRRGPGHAGAVEHEDPASRHGAAGLGGHRGRRLVCGPVLPRQKRGVAGPARRRSGRRVPWFQRGGEQPAWALVASGSSGELCGGIGVVADRGVVRDQGVRLGGMCPYPRWRRATRSNHAPWSWALRCCRTRRPCITAW